MDGRGEPGRDAQEAGGTFHGLEPGGYPASEGDGLGRVQNEVIHWDSRDYLEAIRQRSFAWKGREAQRGFLSDDRLPRAPMDGGFGEMTPMDTFRPRNAAVSAREFEKETLAGDGGFEREH